MRPRGDFMTIHIQVHMKNKNKRKKSKEQKSKKDKFRLSKHRKLIGRNILNL